MARVIVTLKIMPEEPDANVKTIEQNALQAIKEFAGECETKTEIEPIAFGLSAVNITFVMDEQIGSTEPVELAISKQPHVASVVVTDVRRAIG